MGLKNISQQVVNLKYNGIKKDLKPGDVVDVRDFNIQNHTVLAVEENLLNIHRGADDKRLLEHVSTSSDMSAAQINEEVARLNAVVKDLEDGMVIKDKELEATNKENVDLKALLDAANKELEALKKEVAALKKK
jgi:hypothetical protein